MDRGQVRLLPPRLLSHLVIPGPWSTRKDLGILVFEPTRPDAVPCTVVRQQCRPMQSRTEDIAIVAIASTSNITTAIPRTPSLLVE